MLLPLPVRDLLPTPGQAVSVVEDVSITPVAKYEKGRKGWQIG
jgi:hypothetical protein